MSQEPVTTAIAVSRRPSSYPMVRELYGQRAAAHVALRVAAWPWSASLENGQGSRRFWIVFGAGLVTATAGMLTATVPVIVAGLALVVPYAARCVWDVASDVRARFAAAVDDEVDRLARADGTDVDPPPFPPSSEDA